MPRYTGLRAAKWQRQHGPALDVPTSLDAVTSPRPVPAPMNDDLPAIKPLHPSWFRVSRAEYPKGERGRWKWVPILETRDEGEAIRVANSQKWKCAVAVTLRNGWVLAPTFAPMKEVEPDGTHPIDLESYDDFDDRPIPENPDEDA